MSGRFLSEGVSSGKINQNGSERGRRTATLPYLCNHDVDEQQAAFQHAPHPARAQVHASALQLGGHPQSVSAHAVGESGRTTPAAENRWNNDGTITKYLQSESF